MMLSAEQKLDCLLDMDDKVFDEAERESLGWWCDAQMTGTGWYPSMRDDIEICRIYNRVVLGVVERAAP